MCLVGLSGASAVAKPGRSLRCRYHGANLLVAFSTTEAGEAAVTWQGLDLAGKKVGAPASRQVRTVKGSNQIAIEVQPALDHQVRVEEGTRTLRGECHRDRGEWAAGPKRLAPQTDADEPDEAEPLLVGLGVKLGGSFSATVTESAPERLVVERTFGVRSGHGMRPPKRGAFVLVARGTLGPVRLSLAERVGPGKLHYWDYYLDLDRVFRRYVIPLEAFRYRGPENRAMVTVHSLAIQSAEPAPPRASLEIAGLGLSGPAPRLAELTATADGVKVKVRGARPNLKLHLSSASGEEALEVPNHGRLTLKHGRAQKAWLCYEEGPGVQGCDPPDAPRTRYAVPERPGGAVLLDDFSTRASVNAHRRPLSVFASSYQVEANLRVQRKPGALRLAFDFTKPEEYAGFMADLPATAPASVKTLELKVRGTMPPGSVTVSLRDDKGHEPRLSLGSYLARLKPDWSTARIPLAAFASAVAAYGGKGGLGELRRLALGVSGAERMAGWIELGELRLVGERSPLVLARFDGPRTKLSDLAGSITVEKAGGAGLAVELRGAGKVGHGLKLTASRVGGPAYALVAVGLGLLDARGYSHLAFWVRGEKGGETADLVLQSGRKRAKVKLSKYASVTGDWQKVRIPLSDFKAPGVSLAGLTTAVILFGDRELERESLFFDELMLE